MALTATACGSNDSSDTAGSEQTASPTAVSEQPAAHTAFTAYASQKPFGDTVSALKKAVADNGMMILGDLNAWICAHRLPRPGRASARLGTRRRPGHPATGQGDLSQPRQVQPGQAHRARTARPARSPGARHRATFDAFATAQLPITMASRYDTWDQLVAAAVPPGLPGAPEPEKDPTLW
ncbi:hypothetical protein [Streptomyces sp. NPDC058812]|uniref:hypothetical protein n=1 Tax=unclassified Streptomyces TaxID=2593676 RepID=UPI003693CD47